MLSAPLVSVVMPAYNAENYISFAIDSIINQSYENWELIVLNDGSTDDTVKIIEKYKDPRIKLFHNSVNLGLAKTRNRLFELASGEYIVILDSDDIAYPDRIKKQVEFLQNNLEFGMVGAWITFIDERGRKVGKTMKYGAKPHHIPAILFLDNYFSQSAITLRTKLVEDLDYRLDYPPCEDYDLWIRIARKTKVYNLQEVLVNYRIHDSNISTVQAKKKEESERKILEEQLRFVDMDYNKEKFEFFYLTLKKGEAPAFGIVESISTTLELIRKVVKKKDPTLVFLPRYLVIKLAKAIAKSHLPPFLVRLRK